MWNDDNCAMKTGFICKKRNGTDVTRKPTPSAVAPGYCPSGYFGIGRSTTSHTVK